MNASLSGRNIPNAMPAYPKGFLNRVKYIFWKIIYPAHNPIRDVLLALGILKHTGRQPYTLGILAPGKTVEGFLKHLESRSFGNHFIAWHDDGQVASLRRLDGFEAQYHVRIFKDREVRGHYEFTPEYHPILHFKASGKEARRDEFLAFLGEWVITE